MEQVNSFPMTQPETSQMTNETSSRMLVLLIQLPENYLIASQSDEEKGDEFEFKCRISMESRSISRRQVMLSVGYFRTTNSSQISKYRPRTCVEA